MNTDSYFFPYQTDWLNDKSRFKIWEKSRRIGATYVQSYEDVEDCAKNKNYRVYFSSADDSAAVEYIDYCARWCELFKAATKYQGEELIDPQEDIKARVIEFRNGSKIYALTSSPSRFRSKGGKVVLDEFAWHKDAKKLWDAARPSTTWGYPLRILSTYNGKANLYYHFIEDVRRGRLDWSLHTTSILTAVEQGLADKILGRKLTQEERQAWLDEERANCGDETTWQQEYLCVPVDESTAFLTYELIRSCERDNLLHDLDGLLSTQLPGGLYFGVDVGRKKDLTVIWGVTKPGRTYETVYYKELAKTPFAEQRELLYRLYSHRDFRRACMDSTGLGMQLAEEAAQAYGKYRVEPVSFTGTVKEDLAYTMLRTMEDRALLIPPDTAIREDLHSIRKQVTQSGNIRFDVGKSDASGHADRFWAAALSIHAAKDDAGTPIIISGKRRKMQKQVSGYFDS